jgi:hypothetical protein
MFPELRDWSPTLDELWDMNLQRAKICHQWHHLVKNEDVDVVLCAGYQAVAPKHDVYGLPIYTVVQNLLNWPSGVLTVGRAEKEADRQFLTEGVRYEPDCKSTFSLPVSFWHFEVTISYTNFSPRYTDDADACNGLPTHIQIMGKPMMDEELLSVMQIVEDVVCKEH